MKSFARVLFVLFFGTFSRGLAFQDGGSETHGGDSVAAAFVDLAVELQTDLRSIPPGLLPESDISQRLDILMTSLIVESQERVFFEGHEVQAINIRTDQQRRVVVSRSLWDYSSEKKKIYERLVLHELLPLIVISDRDYRRSSELLQIIELSRFGKINLEFIKKSFQTPEQALLIRKFISQMKFWAVETPDLLVNEITLFAKQVVNGSSWEMSLQRITNQILGKIPARQRRQNHYLECAVAIANEADLAWFYEIEFDLRDLYPQARCAGGI